mgnify:FL=1
MFLHTSIIAALLGTATAPLPSPVSVRSALARTASYAPPGIRLWTSHSEVYSRGERVRVFFRTEQDAYVSIMRVDTDGRVRILFPREPWEDHHVRGGSTYDVPNYGRHDAFVVDDDPGVGYIFGVASADPFAFDAFTSANHWDLQLVADGGRIHGDPYQSLEEMVQRIIPAGYTDYDTHLLPYYVERRYDYPRFACYDCHAYVGYNVWNPYTYWCPRFTLFVYNDPFYFYPSYWYPTRYYGGTRVVYVSPTTRGSRYVFKAREDQSAPSIAYRDRRRGELADRRPADRGVRGADIGGVGTIPTPGGRRTVGADANAPAGGRLVPETRIPLIGGEARTPGRREVQPPTVTPGPKTPSLPADAGRRRPGNQPPQGGADVQQPRQIQLAVQRPRGVIIDPYAEPKVKPEARPQSRDPNDAPGRRSEPVYLGRPQGQPESRPAARPPESRPEPRAEPRPSSPPPRAEPRSSSPPPRAEPRPSSPPPRAEPRSSSPPSSRPSSPPPSSARRRP